MPPPAPPRLGECLLRQTGPSGGPEPLVHHQGSAIVRFGGGYVPERGRECAEVVVDAGVVGLGRAAA